MGISPSSNVSFSVILVGDGEGESPTLNASTLSALEYSPFVTASGDPSGAAPFAGTPSAGCEDEPQPIVTGHHLELSRRYLLIRTTNSVRTRSLLGATKLW